MEFRASYILEEAGGDRLEAQDARVKLDDENLSILPVFGDASLISHREIEGIFTSDYRVLLRLVSGEKVTIYNLGRAYEDFLRILARLRNELLLKDMLMNESVRKSGVEAQYTLFDESGAEERSGNCEVRLYETALVIIPENADPLRIPHGFITGVSEEDYSLVVVQERGEKCVLRAMGRQFDPLKRELAEVMNELSLKTQAALREMLPGFDPSLLRKAAKLMREGRAVRRMDMEAVSPAIWNEMEKWLGAAGSQAEYEFLKSISQPERICIGLKRGLMGDLTGEYIWFLVPIYGTDPQAPGNAIAMEAASERGGPKATYFFRIMDREEYAACSDLETLHEKVDESIERINRCLIAVNFRRAPIYLPEERLREPAYAKYLFALYRIPELRELRRLYLGRVIHRTLEQWKSDVMDLLRLDAASGEAAWNMGNDYRDGENEHHGEEPQGP